MKTFWKYNLMLWKETVLKWHSMILIRNQFLKEGLIGFYEECFNRDIFVIEVDKWFVKFLNLFSLNSFTFYYELMKLDNESFVMNLRYYEPLIWLLIFWAFNMTSDILSLWYDFWYSEPLIWTSDLNSDY